jgi:hypothetical protein
MSRAVSDEELEAAMGAWARESLEAIKARTFTLTEVERRARDLGRNHRRRWLPALAAAAVLALVTAGLLIAHVGNGTSSPATTYPTRCPQHPPRLNGASDRPVADGGPLFTSPVASMTACSYVGSSRPRTVPLAHLLATQLAQHLNNATSTSNDPLLCLEGLNISVLLARDDRGRALPPVTLTPGCRQITASNRTTTRYLAFNDPALRKAERYVGRALRHR